MVEQVIRVDELYTPTHVLHDASIVVSGGVVERIVERPIQFNVDYRGYLAAPGLIDTHMHGCCGVDITSVDDVRQVAELSRSIVKFGVTSIVPTLVSARHERIIRVLGVLRDSIPHIDGARVVGFALEGPYINPRRKGAQDPEAIRPANVAEFNSYVKESGGLLKLIHMAPEVEGGFDLIQEAVRRGVYVSIGHTDADYDTVMRAIALGANRATHLYDAMSGIHHRELGAAAALLYSEDTYLELITDLIHVRGEVVKFTIGYAGPNRVVLVTDSIAAAGLSDGEYVLGKMRVIVRGGRATLPDGTLAGSTLTLDRAIRNLVGIGIEPRIALTMATQTPARSLGLTGLGCIRPGCSADIAIFDKGFKVYATYVGGVLKYVAG